MRSSSAKLRASTPSFCIGMDVHAATISVAVKNAEGKLLMECVLETNGFAYYFVAGKTEWPTTKANISPCLLSAVRRSTQSLNELQNRGGLISPVKVA